MTFQTNPTYSLLNLACDLLPSFCNYHPSMSVSVGDVSVMIEISELDIYYLITSQSVPCSKPQNIHRKMRGLSFTTVEVP